MKKWYVIVFAVIAVGLLCTGCSSIESIVKHMYFDGTVIVECQRSYWGKGEFVTFEFYEKGTYKIHFEGKFYKCETPKDFTRIVKTTPRKYIIEQRRLPDHLTVTIEYNGAKETHEFK